jgi:hypothetical protein
MTGDIQDFVFRLRSVLPTRWFPDDSPILDTVLTGLASGWSGIFDALTYVKAQARVATATDVWLDVIVRDYFGPSGLQRNGQPDDTFRRRILAELLRERATRHALCCILQDLTGRTPTIFEPANPADTGGYGGITNAVTGLAYAAAGGWGSLGLPFQAFVTAYRPTGAGIAAVCGWGGPTGGYGGGTIEYASLSMIVGQVTDQDINRAIASVTPVAAICWTRISS